jgi:hypothetical protein
MGKRPLSFKESDITRALRAAKKAGVDMQVTIDLERKTMTLTPVKISDVSELKNPWDEVLEHERH